jgi:hypothetical protein
VKHNSTIIFAVELAFNDRKIPQVLGLFQGAMIVAGNGAIHPHVLNFGMQIRTR